MKGIPTLQKVCYKSLLYLERHSATILTCLGAAGVVVTSVMAVKAIPKAIKLLEAAANEKDEDLTRLEAIQIVGPVYIPTLIIGISTISCIFGANALNKRQQAAITSAYIFVDNAYKEYRNKIKEMLGKDMDIQIRDAIIKDKYIESDFSVSDEKYLFYEEHCGKFFERTKEEVLLAEYHFNRNFTLRGYASLNEFYEFLGLPATDFGDALGWSLGSGFEFYGYSWVDFEHKLIATIDDGLECYIITMPFPPTADYLDF